MDAAQTKNIDCRHIILGRMSGCKFGRVDN